MNMFKRYIAIAITLICTLSFPLLAMKEEIDTCTICLEEKKDNLITLDCGQKTSHIFHKNCIESVARTNIKKLKSTFPCPICRKEQKMSLVLTEEEIQKTKNLYSLIHKASQGNYKAAQEIVTNHTMVTIEDLVTIFTNASEKEFTDIIELFLSNKEIVNTLEQNTITEIFIKAFEETTCIDTCLTIIHNETGFKTVVYDQNIKEVLKAIKAGDENAFNNAFLAIKKDTNNDLPLLALVLIFSACSSSKNIRQSFFEEKNQKLLQYMCIEDIITIIAHASKKDYNDIIDAIFNPKNKAFLKQINNDYFNEILDYACENGQTNIIKEFLKPKNNNTLKKIPEKNRGKALWIAIKNNDLDMVQEFLKPENNFFLTTLSSIYHKIALCKAIEVGSPKIVNLILAHDYVMSRITTESLESFHDKTQNQEFKNLLIEKINQRKTK